MSKTTRKNKNISSIITYQQRDVVKSLTVDGASDLMDLSTDKGHVTLILNRDSTKLNVSTFTAYKKETKTTLDDLQGQITYNFNNSKEQVERLETKIASLQKQIDELKK